MDQKLNNEVKKYTSYYRKIGENYVNSIKEKNATIKYLNKQLNTTTEHNNSLQKENKKLWKAINKLISSKNQSIIIEKKNDNIVSKPMNIQTDHMKQILGLSDELPDIEDSISDDHVSDINIKPLSLLNPDDISVNASITTSPIKRKIKKEHGFITENKVNDEVEIIEIKKETEIIDLYKEEENDNNMCDECKCDISG